MQIWNRKWNTSDISLICYELGILNENRFAVYSPESAVRVGVKTTFEQESTDQVALSNL